ncbi:MAG: cation-translocating P-type ATPase [Candidatus Brocadiia bacterium]
MSQNNDPAEKQQQQSRLQQDWHCMPVEEVSEQLGSDLSTGLSSEEADERQQRYGRNELRKVESVPWHEILFDQFKNVVVLLLAAAAIVSFALGHMPEGISIVVVILLNSGIGFITELRANRAMEALQKLGRTTTSVIRDGDARTLPAAELVPGDVILLEEGQSVPADSRLFEAVKLKIDESPLTGESLPVSKSTAPLEDPETPLADRENMVYRGTNLTTGNARAIVVATGEATEIGRVGKMLEGVEEEETPLEQRLARMSRRLIWICLGVAIVVAISGIVQGEQIWHMIEAGIALAVAAIPEGLPAVATITLAVGMKQMARRNALIRNLPAVETLGSVTSVCTDKTGTLTRSEMAQRLLALPGEDVEISGVGYSPEGEFKREGGTINPRSDPRISAALSAGALCNNATLRENDDGHWEITGDPTEGALVVAAEKAGISRAELHENHPEKHEYPFTSETMIMGTVNANLGELYAEAKGKMLSVKGAPTNVLPHCNRVLEPEGIGEMTEDKRQQIERKNESMAEKGLRVLGLACRTVDEPPEDREEAFTDLLWLGLAGIMDPPRKEAAETVKRLTEAGIKTVMITGDQPMTARAIAAELGVAPSDGPVLSGREIEALNEEELAEHFEGTEVFARVSPEHKMRILDGLQKRGEICAMLGDGVNDAAALKSADIGVAMGIRGTDVAKETSDMVLLDDQFSTVGEAVHRGRIIYDNIQKFITYLFSCNLGEILTMLGASLIGKPLALLPLQILWMNLITDVFPALALAVEPGEPDVMERPPKDPDQPLLERNMLGSIGGYGILMTLATLLAFFYGFRTYGYDPSQGHYDAVTLSFLTIAFAQLFHVFNCRKQHEPMRLGDWFSNMWMIGAIILSAGLMLAAVYVPFLKNILKTMSPDLRDWGVIIGCAILPLIIGQTWRWVRLAIADNK